MIFTLDKWFNIVDTLLFLSIHLKLKDCVEVMIKFGL